MKTFDDEFTKELERCKELLNTYKAFTMRLFGATTLKNVIKKAEMAQINKDHAEMLKIYNEMKEWQ